MWGGSEIATPEGAAGEQRRAVATVRLGETLPIGMEKKPAIIAFHQSEGEFAEPNGAIAQIVCFPPTFGKAMSAEENGRDVAIGGAVEPPIERAQALHQTVALGLGKCGRIRSWIASVESKPEAARSFQPDVEQRVQR